MTGADSELLDLPAYDFEITYRDGDTFIYDRFRHQHVALTPEEWVRQHFIRFLVEEQGVPAGLVAVEFAFRYETRSRRADAVIFDRKGKPVAMVECKAPGVVLSQSVFDQIARYNVAVGARYLLVTNGRKHFCYTVSENRSISFLNAIPTFEEMLSERPE